MRLGNLLEGKPAILVLADYECVHLCSVVLNATLESVRQLRLNAGKDYQIIVISIRPEEDPRPRHGIAITLTALAMAGERRGGTSWCRGVIRCGSSRMR